MNIFIIDVSKCSGCYNCQIACKDEHVENDWSPYAKPQPETGQFWLKQNEFVRGDVPKVNMYYRPVLCMHCDDAPCIDACEADAIYERDDGIVIIDPQKCEGKKDCIEACPYDDVIYFNEDLGIAQKCTGCAHLLDNDWEEPRCVDACPTGALKFGEKSQFEDLLENAEVLDPDEETDRDIEQRVYYLNIPKKFVAGSVYDPQEKEVIEGAECTLVNNESEEEFTVTTDGFGDFWFEDLEVSTFSLEIKKDERAKTIDSISTKESVNLGNIKLQI